MDRSSEKIIKAWLPMTETAFYILLALQTPRHGYGITKYADNLTGGRIKLGSGTVYGTLTKMKRDGLIEIYDDTDNKTVYRITALGGLLLSSECDRLSLVYKDAVSEFDPSVCRGKAEIPAGAQPGGALA